MSFIQNRLLNNLPENNKIPYLTPRNNSNVLFRYTRNQFCPFQRFVDHRPNPHRPSSSITNYIKKFNYPTEKEKYVSCYKFIDRSKLYPLITRQDLSKYFNFDATLLKHFKPCFSCKKINQGNYGKNYYSLVKKSFPFIKGNFSGNITKFFPKYSTPTNSRNFTNKLRNKFIENIPDKYNTEEISTHMNTFRKTYNEEQKNQKEEKKQKEQEEHKEEIKKENKEGINNENPLMKKDENNVQYVNILTRNNSTSYFNRPTIRRRFHKTQIFNHCKPFLVDEFKEYADYK